jgi:hypothetical protein
MSNTSLETLGGGDLRFYSLPNYGGDRDGFTWRFCAGPKTAKLGFHYMGNPILLLFGSRVSCSASSNLGRALEAPPGRGKNPSGQFVLELDCGRVGACADLCIPRSWEESYRAIHLPKLLHDLDAQVSSKTLALSVWRRYSGAELSSLQCPQPYSAGYSCRERNR